jgi:hypothetical protein
MLYNDISVMSWGIRIVWVLEGWLVVVYRPLQKKIKRLVVVFTKFTTFTRTFLELWPLFLQVCLQYNSADRAKLQGGNHAEITLDVTWTKLDCGSS